MKSRTILAVLVLGLAWPAGAGAQGWGGRVALELEYLGENYFHDLDLPLADLTDAAPLEPGITRFRQDEWLPGQRLDLSFDRAGTTTALDLRSSTAYNRERFSQDLRARFENRSPTGSAWTVQLDGALRRDDRSLVGEGDWRGRFRARHRRPVGTGWTSSLEGSWERSRALGDTVSFLTDYDLGRVQVGLTSGGSSWLPVWDLALQAARKQTVGGLAGAYAEGLAAVGWRPAGGRGWTLQAEARLRDYDADGDVGRDFTELRLDAQGRPLRRGGHSLEVDLELVGSDFARSDEIYYDSIQLTAFTPWRWEGGSWATGIGPRVRTLVQTDGADRDFHQLSMRGEVSRSAGLLGFLELTLEAGYRDYRRHAETIELTTLSATLLRSDYWLVDALLLADVPVWGGFTVNVIADTSVELHVQEDEHVQVTFATVSLVRPF